MPKTSENTGVGRALVRVELRPRSTSLSHKNGGQVIKDHQYKNAL